MDNYKGIFNWKGQVFELQTSRPVKSPEQALAVLVYGLSKKVGYKYSYVLNFFLGKPYSYELTKLRAE